jgi:hypothetical protein
MARSLPIGEASQDHRGVAASGFLPVSARPSPICCWLLRSSYYRQPLSPFPLFPIEGSLELRTKEGRNFSGLRLEADKLMSSHQDRLAVSIGHWRLGRAATVATTGMYANQGSDDVHFFGAFRAVWFNDVN